MNDESYKNSDKEQDEAYNLEKRNCISFNVLLLVCGTVPTHSNNPESLEGQTDGRKKGKKEKL